MKTLKCPYCNNIIIDKNREGYFRLKTRIVLFEIGHTISMCPNCKRFIEIPVILKNENVN